MIRIIACLSENEPAAMNVLRDLLALERVDEILFFRIILIRKRPDWTLQVFVPAAHAENDAGLQDMEKWSLTNATGNLLDVVSKFLANIATSTFSGPGYYVFEQGDLRKFLAGILIGEIGLLIEVREEVRKRIMDLLRDKHAPVFSSKSVL